MLNKPVTGRFILKIFSVFVLYLGHCSGAIAQPDHDTSQWQLVWSDEFNKAGRPDSVNWTYETGFVRNEEDQWYQPENAECKNGRLFITAKKVNRPNPDYIPSGNDWRKNRKTIGYTSSCLITKGLHQWLYGRFEMKAKIDIAEGLWPAWWMLGITQPWPANGEIDIMEYYRGKILANIACADGDNKAKWYSYTKKVNSDWASRFHTWRMDWDSLKIDIYVDDELLNETPLDSLTNRDGTHFNPFRQPAYMLLNLAIGGMNGGDPSGTKFPKKFDVDYIRVYQKK